MTKTPKIAIYYPRAMHGDGGITNSLWLWSESLRRAGAEVDVLYDPRLPVSTQRSVPSGVRVQPVRHRGRGRLAYPLGLDRYLDGCVVLVMHSGNVLFNLVAGASARRRGVSYVVTPHGAYDPLVRRTRKAIKSLWEIAERHLLERAVAVHVFLPPEIDHVHQLAPSADTITAATAFELPDTGWSEENCGDYVAWLGRYDVRHKGLDRLLDAMLLLPPSDRPPVRLHGRDHKDSREVVQQMVHQRGLTDHVTVGGPIDGSEKQHFLLNAAAYIHPARWESYGIALVENLARGVPCVTTFDINLGSELARADCAFVVEGTVPGLASGLRAASAGRLRTYGGRGRDFVRDRLSHETAARHFLDGLAALRPAETPR